MDHSSSNVIQKDKYLLGYLPFICMKLISLFVYHARAKPKQKLLRVHRVWSTRKQQLHQLMEEFFSFLLLVWLEFLVFPVCLAALLVVCGGVVGGRCRWWGCRRCRWRCSVVGGGGVVVGGVVGGVLGGVVGGVVGGV